MATVGQRFKTGEVCQTKGKYSFDGYLDGTRTPSPTSNESVIPLDKGDRFPPINSCDKSAYWRLTQAT